MSDGHCQPSPTTTVFPGNSPGRNFMWNAGIVVAWQQESDADFLAYKTIVESSMSAAITASPQSSSANVTTIYEHDNPVSGSMLGGIIFAAVAVAFVTIALFIYYVVLRKRRSQKKDSGLDESPTTQSEYDDKPMKDGVPVSELASGDSAFPELDNNSQVHLMLELGPAYSGTELAPYPDNDQVSRERAAAINNSPIELDSGEVSPVGQAAHLHRNISAVSALSLPSNEQEAVPTSVARRHTQHEGLTRPLLSPPVNLDKPLPPLNTDLDAQEHYRASRSARLSRANGYRAVPTEPFGEASSRSIP